MKKEILEKQNYIVSESPEINVGERLGWVRKFSGAVPALQSRNYRIYFIGQFISLVGSWLQIVAQGWLVWQLTKSALALGIITAIGALPVLFFSLFGGVIVDRFPKRKILVLTQVSSMALALTLGLLTLSNWINVWQIAIVAFLLGIVNAVDAPARQAFVIEMVNKKEHLSSAIALNSGIFNGARVIGPAIAGVLIAVFGVGWAFIINGISYVGVIGALLSMKIKETKNQVHPRAISAIKEGVSYALKHPLIKVLLIFTGVVSVFGWSYITIMPFVSETIFHMGAGGLSYLYAAAGAGALLGVVMVSMLSNRINPLIFILGGNAVFTAGIILFTLTTNFAVALFFLLFAGAGLLSQFSMMNVTIQKSVVQKYRGRVMSLYTLMFLGLTPLGSFQVGFFTEHFGSGFAIRLGAVISFCVALLILKNRRKIEKTYRAYRENGQQ
ncbi:MAG: MFS transporter [Patescibacteria group bacterium]